MTGLQFSTFLFLAVFMMIAGAASVVVPSDSEFVAAVYEHAIIQPDDKTVDISRTEAVAIVMKNMDVYEEQMKIAKQKNTSIIVFPENGLTGWGYARDSFKSFLEDIPDPNNTNWIPCQDPKANATTPILYRLSCLAKTYSMYLVVNMGDIKPCTKVTDQHCPDDGRFQYNTNVVFDPKGTLVARYHKEHPFEMEIDWLDRTRTPEYITFDTPFGKFGTFICFDSLFDKPAQVLVEKYKIDHVAFPTAWFDALPLLTAVGYHGSWARRNGVSFLSANSHTPKELNTGSGIYSTTGVKSYYRSMSPDGALLIASLPKIPVRKPANATAEKIPKSDDKDAFYSKLSGNQFLFKELSKAEDTLSVCYNGSTTCCSLKYKMADKRADELYALGVYDGLHKVRYRRVCAVIKCLKLTRESCGQKKANKASTIFESFTLQGQLNTPYVFPQVVADNVTLLPGEWDHSMPVTRMWSKQKLSRGLLTAALFGRVYSLDGGVPTASPTEISSAPRDHATRHLVILICLLAMASTFSFQLKLF